MSWRKLGGAIVDVAADHVRRWTAVLGALAAVLGGARMLLDPAVGSVPGVLCLGLAVGGLVATYFGLRARDLGAWAGAVTAMVLGVGTIIAFELATGAT